MSFPISLPDSCADLALISPFQEPRPCGETGRTHAHCLIGIDGSCGLSGGRLARGFVPPRLSHAVPDRKEVRRCPDPVPPPPPGGAEDEVADSPLSDLATAALEGSLARRTGGGIPGVPLMLTGPSTVRLEAKNIRPRESSKFSDNLKKNGKS